MSGPTSLIQFTVWQCGTIDLSLLCELLKSALRHSVCDIILEYYLLTAPICRVPAHYCKGMLSPMHSAPNSPSKTVSSSGNHNRDSEYNTIQYNDCSQYCDYCKYRQFLAVMKETHLSAVERHLPYGITHRYLPLNAGEHAPF